MGTSFHVLWTALECYGKVWLLEASLELSLI